MLLCIAYSLLFKLNIYILYSFTGNFSTFYRGLLFTPSAGEYLSTVSCEYNVSANTPPPFNQDGVITSAHAPPMLLFLNPITCEYNTSVHTPPPHLLPPPSEKLIKMVTSHQHMPHPNCHVSILDVLSTPT